MVLGRVLESRVAQRERQGSACFSPTSYSIAQQTVGGGAWIQHGVSSPHSDHGPGHLLAHLPSQAPFSPTHLRCWVEFRATPATNWGCWSEKGLFKVPAIYRCPPCCCSEAVLRNSNYPLPKNGVGVCEWESLIKQLALFAPYVIKWSLTLWGLCFGIGESCSSRCFCLFVSILHTCMHAPQVLIHFGCPTPQYLSLRNLL